MIQQPPSPASASSAWRLPPSREPPPPAWPSSAVRCAAAPPRAAPPAGTQWCRRIPAACPGAARAASSAGGAAVGARLLAWVGFWQHVKQCSSYNHGGQRWGGGDLVSLRQHVSSVVLTIMCSRTGKHITERVEEALVCWQKDGTRRQHEAYLNENTYYMCRCPASKRNTIVLPSPPSGAASHLQSFCGRHQQYVGDHIHRVAVFTQHLDQRLERRLGGIVLQRGRGQRLAGRHRGIA